jgi:hypothetical protein
MDAVRRFELQQVRALNQVDTRVGEPAGAARGDGERAVGDGPLRRGRLNLPDSAEDVSDDVDRALTCGSQERFAAHHVRVRPAEMNQVRLAFGLLPGRYGWTITARPSACSRPTSAAGSAVPVPRNRPVLAALPLSDGFTT